MRPLRDWLLAGLLTLLPLMASADPLGYAVAFDTLYRVDLATGQATLIGPVGFNDVDGLAFGPDGTLYGAADATAGSGSGISDLLIRIDTNSGAGTLVALWPGWPAPDRRLARLWPQPSPAMAGCGPRRTAPGSSGSPATGAVRLVANTGAPLSGLAANGEALYGIGVTGVAATPPSRRSTRLIRKPARSPASVRSALATPCRSAGADFDASGVLWAAGLQPPDFDRASRIACIDLTTGIATVIGSATGVTDNISLRSMAIAPTAACATGMARSAQCACGAWSVQYPACPARLRAGAGRIPAFSTARHG